MYGPNWSCQALRQQPASGRMRRPDGHEIPEPYAAFVQDYLTTLRSGTEFTTPQDVADAVWRAVTEPDAPMKTPAGADAQRWFREAGPSVTQKDSQS